MALLPGAVDGAHTVCVTRTLSHTGHLASLVHSPDANALILGIRGVEERVWAVVLLPSFFFFSWRAYMVTPFRRLTLAQLAKSRPFRNTSRARTISIKEKGVVRGQYGKVTGGGQ